LVCRSETLIISSDLILTQVVGRLLLYYPLVGFMNAFFYVINFPNLPSTQSDIALMDMIVGHFGHLGFLSAQEMAFSFPRKIVMLASTTVRKAQQQARVHRPMEESLPDVEGRTESSSVDLFSDVCSLVNISPFSVENYFSSQLSIIY
jgi:hypothetical protein